MIIWTNVTGISLFHKEGLQPGVPGPAPLQLLDCKFLVLREGGPRPDQPVTRLSYTLRQAWNTVSEIILISVLCNKMIS